MPIYYILWIVQHPRMYHFGDFLDQTYFSSCYERAANFSYRKTVFVRSIYKISLAKKTVSSLE